MVKGQGALTFNEDSKAAAESATHQHDRPPTRYDQAAGDIKRHAESRRDT